MENPFKFSSPSPYLIQSENTKWCKKSDKKDKRIFKIEIPLRIRYPWLSRQSREKEGNYFSFFSPFFNIFPSIFLILFSSFIFLFYFILFDMFSLIIMIIYYYLLCCLDNNKKHFSFLFCACFLFYLCFYHFLWRNISWTIGYSSFKKGHWIGIWFGGFVWVFSVWGSIFGSLKGKFPT